MRSLSLGGRTVYLGALVAACAPGGPSAEIAPASSVTAPLPGDNYAYVFEGEGVIGRYDTRTAADDARVTGVREVLASAVAPGGSRVAVGFATSESTRVAVIATGTGDLEHLYTGPAGSTVTLAWSRDGTRLGAGIRGGRRGILVLGPGGSARDMGCSAADGFEAWRSPSQAIVHDAANYYTVRVADCATLATFAKAGKSAITFAANGSRVAYFVAQQVPVRDRAGSEAVPELWIAGHDGAGARKVADYQGRPQNARWSPDGTRVVYEVVSLRWANTLHLITYGVESESFTYIAEEKQLGVPSDFGACWSPDGSRIAHDRIYARSTGAQQYTTRQVVVREGEQEEVVFDEVLDAPASQVRADRPERCRWTDAQHVLVNTRRGQRIVDLQDADVHQFPQDQRVLGARVFDRRP
jgi:dipeptidyl aminopeptidase/acylaminoacyl peptidase